MLNRMKKGAAVAALAGTMLLGGGCLGFGGGGGNWWGRLLWDTAIYAGQEFVLDNDNVFDLFEDGTVG